MTECPLCDRDRTARGFPPLRTDYGAAARVAVERARRIRRPPTPLFARRARLPRGLGGAPSGVTLAIVGAVPVSPPSARSKHDAATPVTGSENVTVQDTGSAFTDAAPVRAMESTVGAVVSTVTSWDGAVPTFAVAAFAKPA